MLHDVYGGLHLVEGEPHCLWATRKEVHSMYFDARDLDTVDLVAAAFKDDTEVVGGVLAEECAVLYAGPEEFVPLNQQTNR